MTQTATPKQSVALHIGVNLVDPQRYGGWDGELWACENDARDMAAITRKLNFDQTVLLTSQATVDNVVNGVKSASKLLRSGDIFCLSYAGHGGQMTDINNEEADGMDETWCLYDRQLLDDELNFLFAEFAAGVRILVFSDSCHSGTVTRGGLARVVMTEEERMAAYGTTQPVYRKMPDNKIAAAYRALRDRYNDIQLDLARYEATIDASVRLLSGCQDNQLSAELGDNGRFTATLKSVWNNGDFDGNYDAFHKAILTQMPEKQQPNHRIEGVPDPVFDAEHPFKV